MPFSALVGNDRIKRLLKRAVSESRIAQALILAGPRGVGKHRFALALAQAVNCDNPSEGDACGRCLPCRMIDANEHLDVQTISRDGQFIKIDQMRQMSREAHFRPYVGRRRVYIIDGAERLNENAANSILKTLEEPPETSLLVLVTHKPYSLLETIRSRCQLLSFAPLTTAELERHLTATQKRPSEEIRMLARLARGSIGRALEIDLGEYRKTRNTMVELAETMAVSRDAVRLIAASEYLGKKIERDQFEEHIDVLMVILADVFHLKLGESPEVLTNTDISDRLGRIAEATTFEEIVGWVDRLELVLQGLIRNLNRQLAMEALLISA
jgi:DNA polymerase III subunit delta'